MRCVLQRAISITAAAGIGAVLGSNGVNGFGAGLPGPEAATQLQHLLQMQVATHMSQATCHMPHVAVRMSQSTCHVLHAAIHLSHVAVHMSQC